MRKAWKALGIAMAAAIATAGGSILDSDRAMARPLDEIVAAGTLRVAVYRDNAPFSFRHDGKLVGIDVDLGRRIAETLAVTASFMEIGADESMDDDLRNAIWKGHYLGGGVADVMFNVPYDREFGARNPQVALFGPYASDEFALARDPARIAEDRGLLAFRATRIGVELDTLPDFFLATAVNGALRDAIVHFPTVQAATAALITQEVGGVMARRSSLEAALGPNLARFPIARVPMYGFGLSQWPVGIAVREDSRDLGYAATDVLAELATSGGLAAIYRAHGATFLPPDGKEASAMLGR